MHGVEDLLQIHALVEADIAVQAERVKAIGAAAQRFAAPGEGKAPAVHREMLCLKAPWLRRSPGPLCG